MTWPLMLPSDKFAFLVIGAGRGGTSLLAALLDTHADLEVGFERHAQDCLMGKALDGPRRDQVDERLRCFVSACNADARSSEHRLWGNKVTTEQIAGLEDHNRAGAGPPADVLQAFFNDCFGQRRLVFLLRDGRACVASKVRRAGISYPLACQRWRYCVDCYLFLREHRPDTLFVRFEDLLHQPGGTLERICAHLGVSFQEQMLAGVHSEKLRPEYRHGRVDPRRAAAPDFPSEYLPLIEEALVSCGYAV